MLIAYGEYEKMGFSTVKKEEFSRFCIAAESALSRFTFGRVTKENITHAGKYALCEIIDVFYADAIGGNLTSFSNEGYQERYSEKLARTAMEKAEDIVNMYFERDVVFRGAGSQKHGGKL